MNVYINTLLEAEPSALLAILIPVGVLAVIAILCAVLLSVSSQLFGVKEDETALAIRDCLPGANCGACGFSGCDSYAKALSSGTTDKTNLCHSLILSYYLVCPFPRMTYL